MVWGLQFKENLRFSFNPQSVTRFIQTSGANGLQCTTIIQDAKKTGTEVTPSQQPTTHSRPESRLPGGPKGVPTALDKIFLVWSGQFKSASEIPRQLEGDVIHRARSWGRIRINIGFLFIAAAGGGFMVYLGKQAAARGESMEQQNLEWHRKINEEYQSQQRNKK